MRHRASFGPSSKSRSHPTTPEPGLFARSGRLALLALVALVPLLLAAAGCATWNPPPPQAAEKAAVAGVYSGSLRVSVKGENVRGRSPRAHRLPASGRCAPRDPGQRRGSPRGGGARRGPGRGPSRPPGGLRGGGHRGGLRRPPGDRPGPGRAHGRPRRAWPRPGCAPTARGGASSCPSGSKPSCPTARDSRLRVDDAEIGLVLPAAAFEFPPHPGYRPVDAAEARRLLGGR